MVDLDRDLVLGALLAVEQRLLLEQRRHVDELRRACEAPLLDPADVERALATFSELAAAAGGSLQPAHVSVWVRGASA